MAGDGVRVMTGHPRVVSLVPSVTETLAAWGRDPVACTRFCERPDLPHVGGTKDPDVVAIAALGPDLVVLDAEENRREDHHDLVARGVPVHVLHIRSVDDLGPALDGLARALGVEPPPPATGSGVPTLPHVPLPPDPPRVRAFVPIWRRPWMALGRPTYGASLLARLGVEVAFADRGPYPEITLEEVEDEGIDVVLAPSEPYPFTTRQLPELAPLAPVVFVDGRDLFWWGARTPGALTRLGAQLADLV
jgi:ABC-type Fe3+-hydroxamate transport system substrate-binding protein